jgi:hypothetical protein
LIITVTVAGRDVVVTVVDMVLVEEMNDIGVDVTGLLVESGAPPILK